MKTSRIFIYTVVLWTLAESRHAGRAGRSLDVEDKGSNLTQKQQQEVIHADVLQHFTSTLVTPLESMVTHHADSAQDSTSSFIKEVPIIPEEINVQNLKNDDHLHVTYERKITNKRNLNEGSEDSENKTIKSTSNEVTMYRYNKTEPLNSVKLEMVLPHSSYEQSSSSAVYDEVEREQEKREGTEEVPIHEKNPRVSSKPDPEEWKNYELKKKEKGKKEIPDSVTVPSDYSGAGRIEKPHKDNTIKVKEKNKDSISEALDEQRSTISDSSSFSVSEQDNNKPLGSVDILKVGLSGASNDEPVNQSVNSVINANGVNIEMLKKPKVKYSVKRANDIVNDTEADNSSASGNLLKEDDKNNAPVLNFEPQSTPPVYTITTNLPTKYLNSKQHPQVQQHQPTESTPMKLDAVGKFATPSVTTIVKPSIAFKQQLANKLKAFDPTPTAPMNVRENADENLEKNSGKSAIKSNLRKKPRPDFYSSSSELYIPPTATAWTLVSMKSVGEGPMISQNSDTSVEVKSSSPASRPTITTVRQTTITPVSRVKSFVPWSTRLQRTTSAKPPSTVSIDGVSSSENTEALFDSELSSSLSTEHLQINSEPLDLRETSSPSTTQQHSVLRTTLELDRNITETSANLIQPLLNDVMVKDQSSTLSQGSSETIKSAATENLEVVSSTMKVEATAENSSKAYVDDKVPEKENIIETKQISDENDSLITNEKQIQENKEENLLFNRSNNTVNEVIVTDVSQNFNKVMTNTFNESTNETQTTQVSSDVLENIKTKNISDVSEIDPGTSDILVDGVEEGKSGEESDEEQHKQTTTLHPIFEPLETTMIPDIEEDVEGEEEELSIITDKLSMNHTATGNSTKDNQTETQVTLKSTSSPETLNKNTTSSYVTSFDIVSKENTTQVVTKSPSEGNINWYNIDSKSVSVSEVEISNKTVLVETTTAPEEEMTLLPETTTEATNQETTVQPDIIQTASPASSTAPVRVTESTIIFEDGTSFEGMEDPTSCVRIVVHVSPLKFCHGQQQFRESIASQLMTENVSYEQILIISKNLKDCRSNLSTTDQHLTADVCFVNEFQEPSPTLRDEFLKLYSQRTNDASFPILEVKMLVQPPPMSSGFDNVLAAIILSVIAAICLVLLGILLVVIRKRQGKFNYGQRCTPVSMDDYSLDNISVYNSVRRKGALRASKRSYGNPAFDDPGGPSHPINFAGLANFSHDREALDEEFSQIPMITVKPDELPVGAEGKNRYANVIPLPETRVLLTAKVGAEPLDEYINANYIKGSKGQEKLYIACQAPLQSTVEDFWRMVWQQQTKVILMLTALNENGVEKCADYLPALEITDCHRLFGDFQVTLKKHEVREKYIISSLQLKNLENNLWREVTHLWYSSWPSQGVPEDGSAMIAFLIEARSYMRGAQGPTVVHCSPGTGRTGTVIAIDLCIRDFETLRSVDIPKIVYALRRDRAGAVQTKDQYAFVYQVLNLYATKLTGGALDSI